MKKYQGAKIEDTENGYVLILNSLRKEVIWPDKQFLKPNAPKSSALYDIKVKTFKDNQLTKKSYSEVKTTRTNRDEILINYSLEEYNFACKIKNNSQADTRYSLFCVRNIENQGGPNFKKIKDLNEHPSKDMKQFTIKFK